jgi:hypothetical protein
MVSAGTSVNMERLMKLGKTGGDVRTGRRWRSSQILRTPALYKNCQLTAEKQLPAQQAVLSDQLWMGRLSTDGGAVLSRRVVRGVIDPKLSGHDPSLPEVMEGATGGRPS